MKTTVKSLLTEWGMVKETDEIKNEDINERTDLLKEYDGDSESEQMAAHISNRINAIIGFLRVANEGDRKSMVIQRLVIAQKELNELISSLKTIM